MQLNRLSEHIVVLEVDKEYSDSFVLRVDFRFLRIEDVFMVLEIEGHTKFLGLHYEGGYYGAIFCKGRSFANRDNSFVRELRAATNDGGIYFQYLCPLEKRGEYKTLLGKEI